MDEEQLTRTRRSLHAIAELLIAGPQYREHGTIRLAVTQNGFGGAVSPVRVEGTDLVTPTGRYPLRGSYAEVGAAAGIEPHPLTGVYSDTTDVPPDEAIELDAAAAGVLARALAAGDEALRTLAPASTPVLWPEHFDVGVTQDQVNYGLSPGDSTHPAPYAYVGPHERREGAFWNVPFGALLPVADPPDPAAIAAFYATGRREAES